MGPDDDDDEHERIDLLDPLKECSLPVLRQNSRGQQTLQRRLGDIIHAAHPAVLGNVRLELEGGLEAIDYQALRLVDLAELVAGLYPTSRT